MNTSSRNEEQTEISTFEYTEVSGINSSSPMGATIWDVDAAAPIPPAETPDIDALVAIARREARHEGELLARATFEEDLKRLRATIAATLQEFAEERAGYFQRVESDVVQLALSIAKKVLHREAQVDRTLLAALVRSALTELDETTRVALRVHPSHAEEWQRYFDIDAVRNTAPEIVADAGLAPNSCRIVTDVGTTEISIDSRLREIEQGFFDLLDARSSVSNTSQVLQ